MEFLTEILTELVVGTVEVAEIVEVAEVELVVVEDVAVAVVDAVVAADAEQGVEVSLGLVGVENYQQWQLAAVAPVREI